MAAHTGIVTETLLDITITPFSPESEFQRGRKRRRDFFEAGPAGRATIPSSESATFRGRCRYRSSSRYLDMSRPTSQQQHRMLAVGNNNRQRNTSASPSPSRRKMIRITQLAGARRPPSRSPSRSRSPYAAYAGLGTAALTPRRRRHRTQSRSRVHTSLPMGFEMASRGDEIKIKAVEALVLPITTYEMAAPSEASMAKSSERRGE
ncbi:hypothetical protein F4824DRAFT_101914 [Ustulina deusta]|nr:hypothetical protein F4824DRAFT_101914 [Ustulina deusta]